MLHGQAAHHANELCARSPDDQLLAVWGARNYCGVPVFDAQGGIFGHDAIIDGKPMRDGARGIEVMRIFAARVRVEIDRRRVEGALREANELLVQSEERYRELFDEAPIAYVCWATDTRIIWANPTAMNILGFKPGQIEGLLGTSFFPDTPEANSGSEMRSR